MISVIIPAHDVPLQWVQKCIQSVTSQKEIFEIIFVFDSSNTEIVEITRQFLESISTPIKIYEVNFKSASKTRNFAINKAQYEYLCFLDADDYLLPGAFKAGLYAFSEKLDMVLFDRMKFSEDEKEIIYETNNLLLYNLHKKYKGTIHDIFLRMNFAGIKGLFRKSAVQKVGCFDETLICAEDTDLMFKIMELTSEINAVCIEGMYYAYRHNSGSLSQSKVTVLRSSAEQVIRNALLRRGFKNVSVTFFGIMKPFLFSFYDIYLNKEKILPPYLQKLSEKEYKIHGFSINKLDK